MADHVRTQVRNKFVTALTGLSITGSRVFKSRLYPLQVSDLPALVITTDVDKVDYITVDDPAYQRREIVVRVDAYDSDVLTLDDNLDAICKQVEIAISGDSAIPPDTELSETRIDQSILGTQPVGVASLFYTVRFNTATNVLDVIML